MVMIKTKMNRWRQAAGIDSKDILYPVLKDHQHIGAGTFHFQDSSDMSV